MIALDVLLAFVAATAILIAIPGPNVALIVANSVAHGTRYGLLAVHARLRNRLTGGLLMGAGLGLALARRP